eukprot:Sdes_comp9036_c0_seq1m464
MAEEEVTEQEGMEGEDVVKDSAKVHNMGKQDLEKVTDYAEEKEVKTKNIDRALQILQEEQLNHGKITGEREKYLMSIKVEPKDVALIMNEFEISRTLAERELKENDGDVLKALHALVQ